MQRQGEINRMGMEMGHGDEPGEGRFCSFGGARLSPTCMHWHALVGCRTKEALRRGGTGLVVQL